MCKGFPSKDSQRFHSAICESQLRRIQVKYAMEVLALARRQHLEMAGAGEKDRRFWWRADQGHGASTRR